MKLKQINLINEAKTNQKIELAILEEVAGTIEKNYNPYDYNEINAYAVITTPSKKQIKTPLFWYRDYKLVLDTNYTGGPVFIDGEPSNNPNEPHGMQTVEESGDYHYRLRFTTKENGKHNVEVFLETKEGKETLSTVVDVKEGKETNGVVQIDKTNNRFFAFENGKSFVGNGVNMCWYTDGARKITDYEVWLENASKNNINMIRVWMATWGFCLHWGKDYKNFNHRLDRAAYLDKMVSLTEEHNVYFMLTMLNHGQFSPIINSEWDKNPFNKINGGMLTEPHEFFSNEEAKKAYKNEVKYIMGRYSYSQNILCFELFNEVDWTYHLEYNDPIATKDVVEMECKDWHEEIIKVVKENDAYSHLITTSYKGHDGPAYHLDGIDFINPHDYGYESHRCKNVNEVLPTIQKDLYNKINKPVVSSEIGVDWRGGKGSYEQDPSGNFIRQSLYAGYLGGGCAGAMQWWWDSWIHPYNLYPVYKAPGKFASMLNLNGKFELINEVNDNTGINAYVFENRAYGYVYDKEFGHYNVVDRKLTHSAELNLSKGTYLCTIYDSRTLDVISTEELTVEKALTLTIKDFVNDAVFKIEKK